MTFTLMEIFRDGSLVGRGGHAVLGLEVAGEGGADTFFREAGAVDERLSLETRVEEELFTFDDLAKMGEKVGIRKVRPANRRKLGIGCWERGVGCKQTSQKALLDGTFQLAILLLVFHRLGDLPREDVIAFLGLIR